MELCHYTKIDTMYKILESKKMRFTSLKNVDDQEEKWTKDLYDHGKHIFVCCFTSESKENIALWNMHKGNGEGIRLKFKRDIFRKFTYKGENKNGKYIVHGADRIIKVEYTDDESKIYPEVFVGENEKEGIYLPVLGVYKRSEWNFENEYRYKIFMYNYRKNNSLKVNGDKWLCEVNTIPFEYYDVAINKAALNDMEITLGYNINEDSKKKVYEYIKQYNKKNKTNISVKESYLTGKLN